VIYELMISEFGSDIERTIAQLDYLADLGVNCLELMPVSNVSNTVEWTGGSSPLAISVWT
jgi:maltooligosyltrehalose trehalohydrolase